MTKNAAQQLIDYGQSLWYDNISREILGNGEITRMVAEWGVRGMTSNPTIFDQAISGGSSYDPQIAELKAKGLSPEQAFEEIAVQDIGAAADQLLPIFKESGGEDGFVSIEVSPTLARDSAGTVEEAVRLFERLDRPNIMIKIPGTPECIPAIKSCLEKGININVTLLFSVDNHVDVMNAYCEALRARVSRGEPVDSIRSVASFFVSRVDVIVDNRLKEIIEDKKSSDPKVAELAQSLLTKFGIANCKLAYKAFDEIFLSEKFADLKAAGAAVQRPLWASTSTKTPELPDTIYVEELVGPHTVNTMPPGTLEALVDHGNVSRVAITEGVEAAEAVAQQLTEVGVDIPALMLELQNVGVDKFVQSFEDLNATLAKKL
jgi:transaldolase